MQSCKRNLSTIGKPQVVPGLPELAGLVAQMTSQWEQKAQQKALQDMGMANAEATSIDDGATVGGKPNTAVVQDLDMANAEATTVDGETTAAEPATAAAASDAAPATAVSDSVAASSMQTGALGIDEDQQGPAVDANADAAVDDAVVDAKATTGAAGVAPADAPHADAAETRRQKKKKS